MPFERVNRRDRGYRIEVVDAPVVRGRERVKHSGDWNTHHVEEAKERKRRRRNTEQRE